MQKFYENTIQSKLIKAILSNAFVPIFQVVKPGDKLIVDQNYLTRQGMIKCTKSGIYHFATTDSEEYKNNAAGYEIVGEYKWGGFYPQLTEIYNPKSDFYDSDTHEWFCKYLSAYCSYYEINLMGYCNLFADKFVPNIKIDEDSISSQVTSSVKTIKIPVRFNKKYTICLDSSSIIKIAPVFLAKDNFLLLKHDSDDDTIVTQEFIDNRILNDNNPIKIYSSSSFRSPIVYEVSYDGPSYDGDMNFSLYERDLFMLIQIPSTNNSSIVVLEGDYSDINYNPTIIFNEENFEGWSNECMDKFLMSPLTLMQFNTKESYPYSDRLIEYLLGNVINKYENITGNIQRIQDQNVEILTTKSTIKDVWTNDLRYRIYGIATNSNKISNFDLNGYVDRHTEKILS